MTYSEDIIKAANLEIPWNKLSGNNILVTGATGLIGSSLVDVLMSRPMRDYNVYAMGRNVQRMNKLFERFLSSENFHYLIGDVTKPLQTETYFHYIIHAASGAAPNDFAQRPVEVMKSNLLGVSNMLEFGLSHQMHRFLYVSSGEIYGEGDGRVFSEDYSGYVNSTSPRSCYPSSKRAAETLCVSYAAEYGADVVIGRPCHTYGPHFTENDNRVYAQFIRNVLNGEDIIMKSSGAQYRSWCYVVDCVSALLYILLKGDSSEAYNIADGNSNITIRELAETIAEIGQKKVIMGVPNTTEKNGYNVVTKSVFSTAKIESLGWIPSTSIKEGLEKTINECKRYGY